jgi:hypothetical protein
MVDAKQAVKAVRNGNVDKTQGRQQYRRTYCRDAERKKDPEAITITWYGPSNNFMKFTVALSSKALLHFGNLRKLITQGNIVLPDQPDRESYGLDDNPDGHESLPT